MPLDPATAPYRDGRLFESEMDDIHDATLEVLERTGVFVEDDEALAVFSDGGCEVDRETHVAKIPPEVVEQALHGAPAAWICARARLNMIWC